MQYASRHVFVVSVFSALLAGTFAGGTVAFFLPRAVAPSVSPALPEFGCSLGEEPSANPEEERTIAIVRRASPAVVAIDVRKEVPARLSRPSVEDGPTFQDLPALPPGKRRIGGGSGFIVSADGLIVTNRHVVDDKSAEYGVVLQDGTTYLAQVLDLDPVYDLAILKIQATSTSFVALGDSDGVRVGQSVLAIGNALAEFQNSVTKGIISGKNRRLFAGGLGGSELIEEAIQTDAAINPGNSGGPLLDLGGRVIGVNTAVSEGGQALGFAIPANAVKRAIESVKRDGRIIRPWLGVRYFMIDAETAKRDNLPVNYGALVSRGASPRDPAVVAASPAGKAGIQENDIVLEIQGKRLDGETSLASALNRFSAGDEIDVKILRRGEERVLKLKLDERAPEPR